MGAGRITLSLLLKGIDKSTTLVIIENLMLLSLILGIFFSVNTMIYFDKKKAFFKIPEEVTLQWDESLQKIRTKLKDIIKMEGKANKKALQRLISDFSKRIESLEEKQKMKSWNIPK